MSLPLLLINGVADGPRLYLGAAIHGDEVSGIEILFQACAQVRPDNLAGSIVCVLVQNPLAFQAEHRLPVGLYLKSPLDQTPTLIRGRVSRAMRTATLLSGSLACCLAS